MLVINNSMTDTLENLSATLELPEGLSLATMTDGEQAEIQRLPDIAGGGCESVHWYVRGDAAGRYSVSARLRGVVMPFEEEINDLFVCENQLQVWAGNALHLHYEFPDSTYYNDDYPITVTLENVSDITLYNLSHKIQIEQGMVYYYADGSTTEQIDPSQWYSSGVIPEFHPGDKLIMEMTVNIFFKSERIEQKLEELIDIVDGVEQLLNAYKAVKTCIEVVETTQKAISGAAKALDQIDFTLQNVDKKKLILGAELGKSISELWMACSTSGNKTFDEVLKTANAGVNVALDAITNDPEDWLRKTTYEDMLELLQQTNALRTQLTSDSADTGKFDVFDSLRTLISAIPIRFVLSDVFMTADENNTTSIPWSYSTTPGPIQYFGVTDLSKTLMSYVQYGIASVYEDQMPWYFQLIPGMDDPFQKDEAVKNLQTVENEIKQIKAKSATGDVSFTVWIEEGHGQDGFAQLLDGGATTDDFVLSCDHAEAVMENGVLSFTGDGLISVKPTGQNSGTLHIADSEGNHYIYELGVVPQHDCAPGGREVMVQPTSQYDGFAVRRCSMCGDIMEVELLSEADVCEAHAFGGWETELEATHAAGGIQHRTCTVCGLTDYRFTAQKSYTAEELPISCSAQTSASGTVTLTNRSGELLSAMLVLAVYDGSGRMINCTSAQTDTEDMETFDLTIDYGEDAQAAKIKAFLLDPVSMSPLREVWEKDVV